MLEGREKPAYTPNPRAMSRMRAAPTPPPRAAYTPREEGERTYAPRDGAERKPGAAREEGLWKRERRCVQAIDYKHE